MRTDLKRCPSCVTLIRDFETCCDKCVASRRRNACKDGEREISSNENYGDGILRARERELKAICLGNPTAKAHEVEWSTQPYSEPAIKSDEKWEEWLGVGSGYAKLNELHRERDRLSEYAREMNRTMFPDYERSARERIARLDEKIRDEEHANTKRLWSPPARAGYRGAQANNNKPTSDFISLSSILDVCVIQLYSGPRPTSVNVRVDPYENKLIACLDTVVQSAVLGKIIMTADGNAISDGTPTFGRAFDRCSGRPIMDMSAGGCRTQPFPELVVSASGVVQTCDRICATITVRVS